MVQKVAHGNSLEEVQANFVREGYFVFSIRRHMDFAEMFGLKRKISSKKFITFNKTFRGLVRAGMPITEGFEILLKGMAPSKLRTLLEAVREKLHKGQSLSEAFGDFVDIIPRYYPALLHAGEQSGGLTEVLDRFIEQEQRIRQARKRFAQALVYPAILTGVGLISMYIILTKALPQFTSLYQSTDQSLPAVTEFVMGISSWFSVWYRHLFVSLIVAAICLQVFFRTEKGGFMAERLLLRVPLVGRLLALQNQNIFSRTMRLLTQGGIPVPQALAVTAGAVPMRSLGKELHVAHQEVLGGKTLHEALEHNTGFSEDVAEMIRVGEATGNLGDMLDYLADTGEEQSEDNLEMISNLVAPLLLLLVGLMIGLLVVAMYLPMFGSYDLVGGG